MYSRAPTRGWTAQVPGYSAARGRFFVWWRLVRRWRRRLGRDFFGLRDRCLFGSWNLDGDLLGDLFGDFFGDFDGGGGGDGGFGDGLFFAPFVGDAASDEERREGEEQAHEA